MKTHHECAIALCLLSAFLSLPGCSDEAVAPPTIDSAVPSWANRPEKPFPSDTTGGPDLAVFPEHQTSPDWSANGFVLYRDSGITEIDTIGGMYWVDSSLRGLWVIEVATGARQRIAAEGQDARWSPDGTHIAYVNLSGICTMSSRGDPEAVIVGSGRNPSWSPDGKSIAFQYHPDAAYGTTIWMTRVSGGAPRLVSDRSGFEPEWFRDGGRILYSTYVGSAIALCAMDTNGTFLQELRRFEDNRSAGHARFSPDGTKLALEAQGLRKQIWIADLTKDAAYRVTWEGGENPAWSPDGKKLAYVKYDHWEYDRRGGTIWILDLETGEERQLTSQWVVFP